MSILAQHGYGDADRIESGLNAGVIQGCILGPKDLTRSSLQGKIEQARRANAAASIFFDPQYYAVVVAHEPDARLGNLQSDYSEYFAPKSYRDIRREKVIREEVGKVADFQTQGLGLERVILPGILIQDGLQSESASIAKSFLEVFDEVVTEKRIADRSWITLALGADCFRDMKGLQDLVDEITGLWLNAKGIYLLCETTDLDGISPWCHPHVLAGQMYLIYALRQAGFEVLCGYAGLSAPYLQAAGATGIGFGWFNTMRNFSLDRFRPTPGMARRPNRKYLSRALWTRVDLPALQTLGRTHSKLLNGSPWDARYLDGSLPEKEEVLQHWHALCQFESDLAAMATIETRIAYLRSHLISVEQTRASLLVPFHGLQEQISQTRLALGYFEEVAELALAPEDGHGLGVG